MPTIDDERKETQFERIGCEMWKTFRDWKEANDKFVKEVLERTTFPFPPQAGAAQPPTNDEQKEAQEMDSYHPAQKVDPFLIKDSITIGEIRYALNLLNSHIQRLFVILRDEPDLDESDTPVAYLDGLSCGKIRNHLIPIQDIATRTLLRYADAAKEGVSRRTKNQAQNAAQAAEYLKTERANALNAEATETINMLRDVVSLALGVTLLEHHDANFLAGDQKTRNEELRKVLEAALSTSADIARNIK